MLPHDQAWTASMQSPFGTETYNGDWFLISHLRPFRSKWNSAPRDIFRSALELDESCSKSAMAHEPLSLRSRVMRVDTSHSPSLGPSLLLHCLLSLRSSRLLIWRIPLLPLRVLQRTRPRYRIFSKIRAIIFLGRVACDSLESPVHDHGYQFQDPTARPPDIHSI